MSDAPRPLTVEDLIILNQRAVLIGGGVSGVRDKARLEYAVDRPFLIFNDQPMYPTHYAKAAALMEIIIRDHAFVDGNKRTGQLAGAALLRVLSGRRLYVPKQEGVRVCLAVESRRIDAAALACLLTKENFAAAIKPVAKFLFWHSSSVQAAFLSAG